MRAGAWEGERKERVKMGLFGRGTQATRKESYVPRGFRVDDAGRARKGGVDSIFLLG